METCSFALLSFPIRNFFGEGNLVHPNLQMKVAPVRDRSAVTAKDSVGNEEEDLGTVVATRKGVVVVLMETEVITI